MDVFDFDEYVRERTRIEGVPTKVIRSADEVQQIRDQRAQEQAAMQEQQNAMAQSQVVKNIASSAA
jgi:hypothetical protein